MDRLALLIATSGGAGYLPFMPGTWGAAVAALLFAPLAALGAGPLLIALLAVSGLGVWAASRCEGVFGKKDDGRIVVDEVSGQLIALLPLLPLAGHPVAERTLEQVTGGLLALPLPWSGEMWSPSLFSLLVVTGFVAFRVFDIRKPGPVKWAERRFSGGLGVMADDWIAGVLGAVVVTIPAYFVLAAGLS